MAVPEEEARTEEEAPVAEPVDASKAILYFHQQETGGAFLSQIAIPTTLSAAEYTVSEGSRALVGVFRS